MQTNSNLIKLLPPVFRLTRQPATHSQLQSPLRLRSSNFNSQPATHSQLRSSVSRLQAPLPSSNIINYFRHSKMSLMATEEDYLKTLEFTDEQSFEKLFRYYYEPLANFALKYLGDPEEAEEIVQEVFTYVWQKKGQLDIKTNPKSYLYGAVRNGCLNHIKHQKVENLYVQRALHSSDQFDQLDIMELNDLEATIHAALEKLPPKCKEVFELNRFEGKRYKEIAEHLNISLKTVENQMGKALKVMREELKELLPVLLLVLLEILQNGNGGKW